MGWSWRMAAMLALLAGCGGNTNTNGDDDGAGGNAPRGGSSAGGAGGRAAAPMKDGVPIGDCQELTPAERPSACPAQPPEPLSTCVAPENTVCAYEIEVADGRASQDVFFCNGEPPVWDTGVVVACGTTCGAPGAHVVALSDVACSQRRPSSCDDNGNVYAFPTAQQRLDGAFQGLLHDCLGTAAYGNHFQLALKDGCPQSLSTSQALTPDGRACVEQALGNLRWSCALDLSCSQYSVFATTH
jgi:hypothetical protein